MNVLSLYDRLKPDAYFAIKQNADDKTINEVLNEFKKLYYVHQITYGTAKWLCMHRPIQDMIGRHDWRDTLINGDFHKIFNNATK